MFNYGYGNEWIWILVVVFIIFFLFFNGNNCPNRPPRNCC